MIRAKTVALALLLLLAAGCTADDDTNSEPKPVATQDSARIYSAAISEIHAFDRSSGAPGRPLVYVLTTTDDLAYKDAPSAPSQELSTDLQASVAVELEDEPFELVWIDAFDDAPFDPANGQIADGEGIIITLGNIYPQDDDSVQLSFFMSCGNLCGSGKTYVLNQYFNNWHISGSVGPEIAS